MQHDVTHALRDPWLASSLINKAIRRGEHVHALMAAEVLHRHRGKGIWRRLCLIAYEDIGIADLGLVQRVTQLAVDREYRQSLGSDLDVIFATVTDMVAAKKDRSADYLVCTAHDGRDVDEFRDWCRGQSTEALAAIAADVYVPLERRATAAWCAVATGHGQSFSLGEPLMVLLDAFSDGGLPSSLIEAVLVATRLVREPIILMLPILASAVRQLGLTTSVVEVTPPRVILSGSVPTYCCCRFTATGKAAIRRLVLENDRVSSTITELVPDFRAVDVAAVAAFYADGAPIRRRLNWHQSYPLQHMGMHTDMEKVGCPRDGVELIAAVVREELDHLDDIRCRLLERRPTPPRKPDLFGTEA